MLSKMLERYQIFLSSMKLKVPALYWIAIFFVMALIIGGALYFIDNRIGFLAFAVILDLGVGLPYYYYNKHIEEIERYWPDSLRLIADTMKSGSSFEYSLREASSADFGALSLEYNEVIRRLEMGDTLAISLNNLVERVDSKIVKRTITLIQECLKTGAQLSEVLDDIANDTKMMYRIKKERETKTMLQTIFIFAAGAVIAPFIFGLTNVITTFLTEVASTSGVASGEALLVSQATQKTMAMLLDAYVLLEVAAAAVIVSLMREGKFAKSILMFPVMVVVAMIIYSVSQMVISGMLSGVV